MRTLLRAVAIASLLLSHSAFASTSWQRIDEAFAAGSIDAPTRAIYGLRALKAPETLPAEFRPEPGERPPRCATPLFHRAWLERDAFTPAQAAEYAFFAARPTLASVSNGVNTTVHYGSPTPLSFANQVAAIADSAWNIEFTTFGFLAPLPDAGAGGNDPDTGTDIYLQVGINYAYTATEATNPATPWDDATAYTVIDPGLPNIETYVAHELNHDSQYAYDAAEADVLYEATAVFIEDKVFGASNDYVSFVADFQAHPERNLTFATYDDSYMYGAGIWLRWLSDKHASGSTSIVRSIWENSKQNDTTNTKTFFQALDGTVLPAAGIANVQAMVQEFSGYRWLSGANSDGWSSEASLWQTVAPIQGFTLSNGTDANTTTNPPQALGVNYIAVDATGGVAGDKLTFTLHGGSGTSWGVTKIEIPPTGAATVTPSSIDSGDGLVRIASSDLNGKSKVVFAVTNLGTAGQAPDSADNSTTPAGHLGNVTPTSFTYDVFYSATGMDPAGAAAAPSSCKCDMGAKPSRGFPAFTGFALLALFSLRRAASRRTGR